MSVAENCIESSCIRHKESQNVI